MAKDLETQGTGRDGAAAQPEAGTRAVSRRRGDAGGFAAVTRTRFADHAYTVLFQKIVTGEIPQGAPLPAEHDLCALLSISRPVVREALQRLRDEGLIASRRGSGSFVQPRPPLNVSCSELAEKRRPMLANLEFRGTVEPQAAYFAAERRSAGDLDAIDDAINRHARVAVEGGVGHHLDFGFHLAVATASNNRRFVDAVQMVQHDIDHGVNLIRYLAQFDHLKRSQSVIADHGRILRAIRQQRPEEARKAIREHLENARLRMVQSEPRLAGPE